MIINDWATLDKANGNHYGRGYPLIIHTSGNALLKAAELHTDTVDKFEDGACDLAEAHEAYEVYRLISAYRDRIYRRWMAGTLTTDRLDLLAEAEGERMDRESLRLP